MGLFLPENRMTPLAMLCVLLFIIVTQNYVAMMTHHVVHESFKLKRFMNHMMSHHSYLIKIKFYTKQFVSHISHKSCSRCNLTAPIFKNFPGGHAPDPLDLVCYTCRLLSPPEILILRFSPL